MERDELKVKRVEYSKRVLFAVVLLWFVGALFGMAVVVWQMAVSDCPTALADLLVYIGGPMTGGTVGYLVKSAMENREKIRTQYTEC